MDSAQSEKIVLEIVTNLNTRFLVLPLRSETIGDVRGTIESFHMDLFPTWGEVHINALEVEGSGGKHRLADCLSIRELFWRAPRGAVFAELIPTTKPIELPRLNIPGAAGANVVAKHDVHQTPAESTPSPRRRGLAEGQSMPNVGASFDRKSDLDRKIVDGRHGHGFKPEVVVRQLRTMKRGIDERDSPSDAGERQVQAECAAVDVRKPATKKTCVDRGHPVLELIEPEVRNNSVRKSMFVVESTTRPASCGRPENGEQLQLRKVSLPESCQHSPLPKAVHEIALSLLEPVEKVVVGNSARALDMGELNRNDVVRSETGHLNAENLPAEPGLGISKPLDDLVRETRKAMKKEVLSSSSDMSVSGSESETRIGSQNGIASGKQADMVEVVLSTPERRVLSGGPPNLNGVSEEVKSKIKQSEGLESDKSTGSSSGGSSYEASGQNEDSDNQVPELPGDYKSRSSAESEGEEGSKPVSPREGSVGNNSDQTSSDGDSSQPSRAVSESENIESSSDDSEEGDQTPPKGRKMDFTTPKDGSGAARSIGRRSLGGSKDPKYQHLLESQKGSDELINLSQQKSIVISGSQQELQPRAEDHDLLAPVSLADDNYPKDLVRDKEEGDLNGKCPISDEQQGVTTSDAVEKRKDTKPTHENVTVRRSVRQKDKRTAASVQDGGKGEERLQGRSGPPTSGKLGEASLLLSDGEKLIPSGQGLTETGLEPGEEPPQARSGNSQNIRAALQLARMSATNGVDSNVETPSKKRARRKKGISSRAVATPVTRLMTVHEESSQQEPHIRAESVGLLPEGDDQRLEANLPLSPDQIMAVAEGVGNVLPAPETTERINKLGSTSADEHQIGATEKVASDSDFGRKKQRKRSQKVCEFNTEMTQQDIRGYMTSEPSQGLARPKNASDEAGNKETSGKPAKKRKLATDHVAVQNVVLVLQQDLVPKSLNKNAREGAEEKTAGQLDSRWVCTICDPSMSYTKRSTLTRHLERVHNLEKDDIPSELLQQVEFQTEGQEEVDNLSQLHVAVNQKDSAMGGKGQLEDTAPNLGFEDLSQRASIDDELEKEGRRVTGPVKEFGSRGSAEVQFKGEPTQSKQRRKLSVEFSEDPSRLKKSRKGKKDRDSNQDPSRDHSAFLPEEIDMVPDKEVEETEEDRLVLEEKHSNADDEDNEADEEFTAVVLPQSSKRAEKSSKSSKKARNLETSLMTDVNTWRGWNAAQDVTIPFESVSVKPAQADLPRELPENLQGQHSTVGLKKKRKKSNNLDPSVEGRNNEGHQVELVDGEDQIATQESQEVLTTASFQDGNAKEGDKASQKEKLQQLGFLREDGGSLRKMKDSNSKKSGNGKFAKCQQVTFSGGNLPGKSKAKKSAEGSTGDSSKRKAKARTTPAKSDKRAKREGCPFACGKDFLKKTSAYFRHIKACPLAPGPQIA